MNLLDILGIIGNTILVILITAIIFILAFAIIVLVTLLFFLPVFIALLTGSVGYILFYVVIGLIVYFLYNKM